MDPAAKELDRQISNWAIFYLLVKKNVDKLKQVPIQYDIFGEAKLVVEEIAEILSVHRRLPVDLDTTAFNFDLGKPLFSFT